MPYLDHHAATPLAAAATDAMAEAAPDAWANPASVHGPGRASRAHLETARRRVAEALGAAPADLVFTSGGTEACDLAIAGGPRPSRILTWAIAHPAVHGPVEGWERAGVPVRRVAGLDEPDVSDMEGGLVVVPWVDHEMGLCLDLPAIAARARSAGARVVVDANQALGRIPIDVGALDVDALAVASHKIGGPSGAGALWVRRPGPLEPRLAGGGQERGRRGGSPGVLPIVGFGAACAMIEERLAAMGRIGRWRDRLEAGAVALGAVVNGGDGPRVASCTNVSFRGWRAEHLVPALDLEGLAVSAGAACSSGTTEPSPGVASRYPSEPWRAASAIRMSLGPEGLDEAAIDDAMTILERVVPRAQP